MTDTAVSPFRIDVPQVEVDDLRERLARTRWPAEQQLTGERGIPLELVRRLAEQWGGPWNWRSHEAALNAHEQVTTTIDGTRVHAVHARAADPGAPCLVLLHGWPGSVVEFQRVIGLLVDPAAHGGEAADAVHVVVPSLPGYGFSGPTPDGGWTSQRMAGAVAELMSRLGYDRYVAHGGDWGSRMARDLAVHDAAHVVGIHVTMTMGLVPDEVRDAEDQRAQDRADRYAGELSGYNKTQATKPLSLAPALTDSPVGQLAWIAERFRDWTDPTSDIFGPQTLDQVLANIAVYWFTGTAGSSSQLYWERREHPDDEWSREVPTGVCVLPHDIHLPVRRVVEAATNLVSWTELPRGGHFPAIEVPDLLVAELHQFLRRVR